MPYKPNLRQPYPNELYHFGIRGQKWGVRRFQNADGSYTAAGKKRYNSGDGGKPLSAKKQKKLDKKMEAEQLKSDKRALSKEGDYEYTERKFKEFKGKAKESGWNCRTDEWGELVKASKSFDHNGKNIRVYMEYDPVRHTQSGKLMPSMQKAQDNFNRVQKNYGAITSAVNSFLKDYFNSGYGEYAYPNLNAEQYLKKFKDPRISILGNWWKGPLEDGVACVEMEGPNDIGYTIMYDMNKNKIISVEDDD